MHLARVRPVDTAQTGRDPDCYRVLTRKRWLIKENCTYSGGRKGNGVNRTDLPWRGAVDAS